MPLTMEPERRAVNNWLRSSSDFDAIWDFDAAIREPLEPGVMGATYTSDGTHPNQTGYKTIADSVDLQTFGES